MTDPRAWAAGFNLIPDSYKVAAIALLAALAAGYIYALTLKWRPRK